MLFSPYLDRIAEARDRECVTGLSKDSPSTLSIVSHIGFMIICLPCYKASYVLYTCTQHQPGEWGWVGGCKGSPWPWSQGARSLGGKKVNCWERKRRPHRLAEGRACALLFLLQPFPAAPRALAWQGCSPESPRGDQKAAKTYREVGRPRTELVSAPQGGTCRPMLGHFQKALFHG